MTKIDRIEKMIIERFDALEELRRIKKILVSKIAKKRIDHDIKEICEEITRLHDSLFQ